MTDYKYLIIGGGMTADAAVKGIRQINTSDQIGIISNETSAPYDRPPLSKALWKGDPIEKIWRKTQAGNVDIHLARAARSVDVKKKVVVDDHGTTYSYDKLLLATGGRARQLPYDVEGIIYFRTVADYQNLRALTKRGQTFAIIGGGFIGSEIAAALAMIGKTVTMIIPEDGIGARVFPPSLSHFLNTYYQSKSVQILTQDSVSGIAKENATYLVRTTNGRELRVDGVVAGIGIQPNVEIAQAAGLKVDNGIVVDEFLRTSDLDIYAAGDVANFHNPALNKRIRVEHEDNANTMGEVAGRNMAGAGVSFDHLPFFYSDLFELGYEAVGEVDARLEMVADWKDEFHEGVVYYLAAGRVRGVLLWNTWGQVDAARSLIQEKGPFSAESVKGRLPA